MNVKPLVLAGVATAVSVVTFVALNLVAPISHATAAPDQGITVDQVFAGSVDAPGASAPESGQTAAEPIEVAQADINADASAEASSAAVEAAPTDVPAPAGEPAPVSGGGSCAVSPVDPNAKPVVVKAAGLPETAAADAAPTSMESAPEPAAVAASETAPVVETSAPAAEEAAPAPKPKPKPKPRAPKKTPEEAKVAWWPAKTAGKLNINYAGEASFTKAIVMTFDGAFDNADSANQHIKVTPKQGGKVNGKWLVAEGNKQMLLLNVAPGLYTVEVGEGLADKGNRTVAASATGAVFVH